jgi:hypothetical protein
MHAPKSETPASGQLVGTLGIRPPEYFPGMRFCTLMARVDTFVVADTFQYSRQSYQNRAKLRTPQGWQWISIPLLARQHGEPICNVRIDTHAPWRAKHLRAMGFNYRSSPYFEYYEDAFVAFLESDWEVLADATVASIRLIHRLLDLDTALVCTSELEDQPHDLSQFAALHSGLWLAMGDTLRHDIESGIPAEEVPFTHPGYHQNFPGFEAGMSILDVLFNKGPETRSLLVEEA